MNLTLKEVYQTSAVRPSLSPLRPLLAVTAAAGNSCKLTYPLLQDGETFWKLAECYVRGNNVS